MNDQQKAINRTELIRRALEQSGLTPGPEHPCAYLPDRTARDLAFRASRMSPGTYHSLMDLNFRRSGTVFYRPACEQCRQCRAIRVAVREFAPNRAQRRCWRRNQDVAVELGEPAATEEKHQLFREYLARRHNREMDDSRAGFADFLYTSPIRTVEMCFRLEGRLVAVGVVDLEPEAASTVYSYFDPQLAGRSLGVFNVLWAIDYCRSVGLEHLYLGYYIRDCGKMNYKISFRPCEVLATGGTWHRFDRTSNAIPEE